MLNKTNLPLGLPEVDLPWKNFLDFFLSGDSCHVDVCEKKIENFNVSRIEMEWPGYTISIRWARLKGRFVHEAVKVRNERAGVQERNFLVEIISNIFF